jgi:hypothetical protein
MAVHGDVAAFIDLDVHFVREILFPMVTPQKLSEVSQFLEADVARMHAC